jgi:hypothetical protein
MIVPSHAPSCLSFPSPRLARSPRLAHFRELYQISLPHILKRTRDHQFMTRRLQVVIFLIDRAHCQAPATSVHEVKNRRKKESGQNQSPSSRQTTHRDRPRAFRATCPTVNATSHAVAIRSLLIRIDHRPALDHTDASTNRTDHGLRHSTSHCGRTGRNGHRRRHVRRVHHGSWSQACRRSWDQWVR